MIFRLVLCLTCALSSQASPSHSKGQQDSSWSSADYTRLRNTCRWKTVRLRRARVLNIPGHDLPQFEKQLAMARACRIDASGPDVAAELYILRVGAPSGNASLMSPGGWRAWGLNINFPSSLADSEHAVRLASFHYWPVYENGSNVALPPLYNHHALALTKLNIHFPLNDGPRTPWLGSVADDLCDEDRGGEECSYQSIPPGYAFIVPHDMPVSGVVNDVRPKGSTTEEYPIWYEFGHRVYKVQQKMSIRGVHGLVMHMSPSQWWSTQSTSLENTRLINQTMFDTFALPEGPSFHVVEIHWVTAGRIIDHRWHGHHQFTNEAIVFSGSISGVLRSLGYTEVIEHPQRLNGSLEDAKVVIRAALARTNVRELCRYVPHRVSVAPVAGMPARQYDRAVSPVNGACDLKGYQVKAHEIFSSICFNDGGHLGSVKQQHCRSRLVFMPE